MKSISSNEFAAKFEKLKKLYETNILTFTEFTEQKEQRINELKNLIIHESLEDFLIDISLFQQNYINDEELSKIKKIILDKNINENAKNDITNDISEAIKPAFYKKNENCIKIGNQEWTSKNLNVEQYRNGEQIPQVQDNYEWSKLVTGAWCYYENKTENGETFGKLYNWFANKDYRGLAPEGWEIPDQYEWIKLTDCLGGEKIAGGKMKSKTDWNTPNFGATNSWGFSALPGGARNYDGSYDHIGKYGCFWSLSEQDYGNAWYCDLSNSSSEINRYLYSKRSGLSVRCVRDIS